MNRSLRCLKRLFFNLFFCHNSLNESAIYQLILTLEPYWSAGTEFKLRTTLSRPDNY